jgi:hypothetical protein
MNVIGNLQLIEILRDAKKTGFWFMNRLLRLGRNMWRPDDVLMGNPSNWATLLNGQQHVTGQDREAGQYDSMSTYGEVKGRRCLVLELLGPSAILTITCCVFRRTVERKSWGPRQCFTFTS